VHEVPSGSRQTCSIPATMITNRRSPIAIQLGNDDVGWSNCDRRLRTWKCCIVQLNTGSSGSHT
jgi:hypothetical protein